MGAGMILMIVSLAGMAFFAALLLSTKRSQAKKKEEIYRSIHNEYSRKI